MKVMATYRQKEERDLDEDGKKEIDELPNRIMYAISSFYRHDAEEEVVISINTML